VAVSFITIPCVLPVSSPVAYDSAPRELPFAPPALRGLSDLKLGLI
jgi:hypothetical protein